MMIEGNGAKRLQPSKNRNERTASLIEGRKFSITSLARGLFLAHHADILQE